jgi:periplasmic protein TonB
VKPDRLQLSLGVSLLLHAATLGVLAFTGAPVRNPSIQGGEATATLSLIAAPQESSFMPPQPKIETIAPVASPVQVIPAQVVQPESPVPIEPVTPAALTETPSVQPNIQVAPSAHIAAASKQPAAADVRSDASSPISGLDDTTKTAHPGVKAEPNYLKNPEPAYPLLARRRHQEGLVLLTAKVTAQGRAAEVMIKTSSGFPLLDEAALQAVRDWQFKPARIGSIAVESEIEVPVRFELMN